MTPEEYLKERVEDQIFWYDRKSGSNKMWFIILQIATLVAAASVPVFSIFSSDMWARVTVAILTDEERDSIMAQRIKDIEMWIAEGKVKRWRKSFIEYDPLPTARNVLCPVLIIHGDRDANVPAEHAHLLAEAMRAGGNADVTVRILPNHNHLFLKDTDDRFTDKRYWKLLHHTNKLSEGFLKIMADWVSSRLKP